MNLTKVQTLIWCILANNGSIPGNENLNYKALLGPMHRRAFLGKRLFMFHFQITTTVLFDQLNNYSSILLRFENVLLSYQVIFNWL
jgi:hypothetical protein